MNKGLYLLIVFFAFLGSCKGQKELWGPVLRVSDIGYYSMPNKIGGKVILKDYKNFKNKNDSIYLEDILYKLQTDSSFIMVGNIFGSKSSLVLSLRNIKGSRRLEYARQFGYIDSIEVQKVEDYTFLVLNRKYRDFCAETDVTLIFSLYNERLYKSFEGVNKQQYFDTGDSLCVTGKSFTQKFHISAKNRFLLLISEKVAENDTTKKKYVLDDFKFK